VDTVKYLDAMVSDSTPARRPTSRQNQLLGPYVALLLLILIYFSRPGEWIPGLTNVPLVKLTAIWALFALVFSLRHIRQRLPREVIYLGLLIGQLFLAAVMSPVWRGGAFQTTLGFAKVLVVVIILTVTVNTPKRLRLLITIQAASVAVIAAVTAWYGHLRVGRLEGMRGGSYSNPNDLALAIVISLPLCFALLFLCRRRLWKAVWAIAMLAMAYAVLLTGSRGGFLSLIVVVAFCLWEFGIRGRQRYLFVLVGLAGAILWLSSSGMLAGRLKGTFNSEEDVASAYGSAQARQDLFWHSVDVTKRHPLFGVGPGNFQVLSGDWHVTHNAFTEMSSEGGVPAFILYVSILWLGFKNVRAAKLAGMQKEIATLAGGLQASLAGYVVGSIFASTAYEFFPYFLVAYSTSLFLISKKSAFRMKLRKSGEQTTTEEELLPNAVKSELAWHSY